MTPTTLASSFGEDVLHYLQLTPRQLPSQYLYDALGSALFDAICELPWYGITRAENRLLASHRNAIFAHLAGLTRIVELGPGDGRKLRILVEGTSHQLTAYLIDVSTTALTRAAHTLADVSHVTVVSHQASFEDGLDALSMRPQVAEGRTLVMFLGSNIGNFDPPGAAALLDRICRSLRPGDAFLMGADLVKPERYFLLAYNDPIGVSSSFNLNVLLRINRELGGDFNLRAFRHHVVWNPACARMEMFLVSEGKQHIHIDALDLNIDLEDGEEIWTESSYKYTAEGLIDQLENAGLSPLAQWVDRDDAFALTLVRKN